MFREMRRKGQALSLQACRDILEGNISGVLAVQGDDGFPYAVPLTYLYANGKILFHCAPEGHKLDAMRRNPKVSFCVVDRSDLHPEAFTIFYRSVIAFGTARILTAPEEIRCAMEAYARRFVPNDPEGRSDVIRDVFHRLCMVEIHILQLTGKEDLELQKSRLAPERCGSLHC